MPTILTDVTGMPETIEVGNPQAAEQLLPVVYDELRKLAAARLTREKPGQTLQATALVHEAYLRLVDTDQAQYWNSSRHFFAAAAEAMRRILVEQARRKNRRKHGGGRRRVPLYQAEPAYLRRLHPLQPSATPSRPSYRSSCAEISTGSL
jgi:RNA polymerase sigma factor (TIGR02999 family)